MHDLELIFTMLGEASTTAIARGKDAIGFDENKVAAKEGGGVAGNARKELENKSRKNVISEENYLIESEKAKRLRLADNLAKNSKLTLKDTNKFSRMIKRKARERLMAELMSEKDTIPIKEARKRIKKKKQLDSK